MISTTEAALRLGISTTRVRQLLLDGRIKGAVKKDHRWEIPTEKKGLPKITKRKKGPEATWSKRRRTAKIKIHVNQNRIKSNIRAQNPEPVIGVMQGKDKVYGDRVKIIGGCEVIYSPADPLSCGARVWIELDEYSEYSIEQI